MLRESLSLLTSLRRETSIARNSPLRTLFDTILSVSTQFRTISEVLQRVEQPHAVRVSFDDEAPSGNGPPAADAQRLGQVGVLGVPNAGKSTLVNFLVGTKISAVSNKTNTTTRSMLGSFTTGVTQVVLYDTPGIVGHEYYHGPQHAQRVESAWNIASSCDVLVFVVDAHRQLLRPDPRVERQLAVLGTADSLPPTALILNKVDSVAKKQRGMLLSLADDLKEMANISELFWVSARRGHGMEGLKEWLLGQAKPGSWILSADASTNLSDLDLACELVREKIFRAYYEEIPYEVRIKPVSHTTLADGALRIEMNVLVPSESVRRIVVGMHGNAIRFVGTTARKELQDILKRQVHLFINVKTDD